MNAFDAENLLSVVARQLSSAGGWGAMTIQDQSLLCKVPVPEVQAHYYLVLPGPNQAEIGWRTPDRWISESIETDLLHQGVSLEELLEDELVDLGSDLKPTVEHYRDELKRYTFCSKITWNPETDPVPLLVTLLRAYRATLSQLGDLKPSED